jgi:Trypsin
LIHPQFVLTTVKCIFGARFVNLHVYANNLEDENEDDREIYRSTEYIMHPDFEGLKDIHDLALVKFKSPLNIAAKKYAVINLPAVSDTLNAGDIGTVSGWGLLNFEKESASNLKHTQQMTVQTDALCEATYGPFSGGAEGRRCIKRVAGPNCVSDSGALFIRNAKLFGILSFGQEEACNISGTMNGMQDIPAHLAWINGELAKV